MGEPLMAATRTAAADRGMREMMMMAMLLMMMMAARRC